VGGSEIRIIDAAVHRAQFRTKGTPDSMIYWCRFESEVARTPRKRRREIIRTSRRQQDRCSGHHRPAAPVRIVAVAKYNDRPVRFYRMLVFASSLFASLVPSIHLAEGTMADLDKRTRASLDAVLENACQSLPHGGDHALRKRLHGSF
jgi:hypothetical protein